MYMYLHFLMSYKHNFASKSFLFFSIYNSLTLISLKPEFKWFDFDLRSIICSYSWCYPLCWTEMTNTKKNIAPENLELTKYILLDIKIIFCFQFCIFWYITCHGLKKKLFFEIFQAKYQPLWFFGVQFAKNAKKS